MTSAFKSETKKWDIRNTNQMDPGSYNMKTNVDKKSYLVNFTHKWVWFFIIIQILRRLNIGLLLALIFDDLWNLNARGRMLWKREVNQRFGWKLKIWFL